MYDTVFFMNHFGFYKTNLYNEIAKKQKILVIYLGETSEIRNSFFYKVEKNFEYKVINKGDYERRNIFISILKLFFMIKKIKYNQIITMGWSTPEDIFISLISPKKKNSFICESSSYESSLKGVKKIIKKIILKRYTTAYVSGTPHKKIFDILKFKGEIKITGGVGIINRMVIKEKKDTSFSFLTIARLSDEKNLELLIDVFNKLEYNLTIVGSGPREDYLKSIANDNIKFISFVDNKKLNDLYSQYSVFILPSKSEPWGLVVDEAIYYQTPVIVSNMVGCNVDLVQKYDVGIIFNYNSEEELIDAVKEIKSNWYMYYEKLKLINFDKIISKQVDAYLK